MTTVEVYTKQTPTWLTGEWVCRGTAQVEGLAECRELARTAAQYWRSDAKVVAAGPLEICEIPYIPVAIVVEMEKIAIYEEACL